MSNDWKSEAWAMLVKAQNEGEALVPRDVAKPSVAKEYLRDELVKWDQEDAFRLDVVDDGLRVIRLLRDDQMSSLDSLLRG